MKDHRTEKAVCDSNLAVLFNGVELGSQVVMAVAGNAISNTVDGNPVTPAYLQEAVTAGLQSALIPFTGGR